MCMCVYVCACVCVCVCVHCLPWRHAAVFLVFWFECAFPFDDVDSWNTCVPAVQLQMQRKEVTPTLSPSVLNVIEESRIYFFILGPLADRRHAGESIKTTWAGPCSRTQCHRFEAMRDAPGVLSFPWRAVLYRPSDFGMVWSLPSLCLLSLQLLERDKTTWTATLLLCLLQSRAAPISLCVFPVWQTNKVRVETPGQHRV